MLFCSKIYPRADIDALIGLPAHKLFILLDKGINISKILKHVVAILQNKVKGINPVET